MYTQHIEPLSTFFSAVSFVCRLSSLPKCWPLPNEPRTTTESSQAARVTLKCVAELLLFNYFPESTTTTTTT